MVKQKAWTPEEDAILIKYAKQGYLDNEISVKINEETDADSPVRSRNSVYSRRKVLGYDNNNLTGPNVFRLIRIRQDNLKGNVGV
ncbi:MULTISPECIES: hypothetical protein [Methanobacterium]|uniref:Myb-like domain-containing protein n=1 Tax=Methanobacterium bryantii TaxID=2161 RepID=A0A2A2H8L9_METBR|nr:MULTISPECIES: hypothetical protein [Methanobacterium]PAV05728.1 hypothetical protein ASJ80_08325 [Methanobacterium bryantii]